jgi:uncharacterized protein (TIGR02452 family)
MKREERVGVFLETVHICQNKKYLDSKGNAVMLPSVVGPSKFYETRITEAFKKNSKKADIKVENLDSLIAAKNLIDNGFKPAVLNMANSKMPCGGVLRGSGAQEENISRRSNLFQSLYRYHNIGNDFGVDQTERHNNPKLQYPMDKNFGGIYSKNVVVFRNSEDKNYSLLDEPYFVDVISVAAIREPELDKDGHFTKNVKAIEKNKIRTIFNIALENGNDSIVLGAFGCGAFKTPPKEMAKLFHEIIEEEEYDYKFKAITFAIIESNSNYEAHNPEGNLKPFVDEFAN